MMPTSLLKLMLHQIEIRLICWFTTKQFSKRCATCYEKIPKAMIWHKMPINIPE